MAGLQTGLCKAEHVSYELASRVGTEDSLVLDVLDLFHAEVALGAGSDGIGQLLRALRSTNLRFLGSDQAVADLHMLRQLACWELSAETLLEPADSQRKSIPGTYLDHLCENPEVIVEVALAGFLSLNARYSLQSS